MNALRWILLPLLGTACSSAPTDSPASYLHAAPEARLGSQGQALSGAELSQALAQAGSVLVKFGATWCPPCIALAPELDRLAEAKPALAVISVDRDHHPELAQQFAVQTIPTMILVQDGREMARLNDYHPLPKLVAWLDSLAQW